MTDIALGGLGLVSMGLGDDLTPAAARTKYIKANEWSWVRNDMYWRGIGKKGISSVSGSAYNPILVSDTLNFSTTDDLDLNEILLPLLTGIESNPTITTPSGADRDESRVWTFDPSRDRFPKIKYASAEWLELDSDEARQVNQYQAHKGFCTGFTIASGGEEVVSLACEYQFGAQEALATPTTLLAPDPAIVIPAKSVTVGFYDTYALMVAASYSAVNGLGLGTSLPTLELFDCNLQVNTGHGIRKRKNGAIDYDAENGTARGATLGMNGYISTSSTDIERKEQSKKNDFRYVLLRMVGTENIDIQAAPYILDIGLCLQHDNESISSRGAVGDGDLATIAFAMTLAAEADKNFYVALQTGKTVGF